jgi:tripartite-type tricarboxylate transporter receptor subunit TctC
LAAANYMSQIAPKDGFVIGLTNRNFAVAPLLGIVSDSSVKYDPKAFNWVANLNSEVSIFIVRSDRGVSSVRDLPSSSLQLGATGLTANNAMYPNVVNQLLGSRLTVVTGYPGAHHVTLALERGEVDGIGGYSWSTLQAQRPEWVQNGFIVPILQIGATTIPELGSVPSIMALARSEQERRALELIVAPERMGRPFFLPPKTAPDVVAKTRDAFSALSRDEAFQGAAAKSGLEITFMDGRSVQEYVEQLNSAPAEVVTLAKQLLVTKTSAP